MQPDPALGLAIRRARERRHMTQQQLADAAGVSLRSVSNWELGHHVPRNRTGALEEILGISLAEKPAGPLDDIRPADEWEAAVLADDDLPDRIKRQLISDSRAARAAYAERKRQREAPSRRDPGRAAG